MAFIPRAPRDSFTKKFRLSEIERGKCYRSSGLIKVDDQPNLHVERYLLNRFDKDVLLKTVFE